VQYVALQDSVERTLESGVDVEHDRIADLGLGRVKRADDAAVGADFDGVRAVVTAQVLLVEGLDTGLAIVESVW